MEERIEQLKQLAINVRKEILIMTNRAGMGHVGGSLSEVEILLALYHEIMRIDPKNPDWPDRDRFILSKGHATPGFYTVLAEAGYFDKELLKTFDEIGTKLQAHPDMHKCPGVDYSSGSLGQGLSIGVGMAEGARALEKNYRTFVLLGDGESQEGQVWEALMYAGSRKVPRVIAIFDMNGVQLSTKLEDAVDLGDMAAKLREFGWFVIEADGHDFSSLLPALRTAVEKSESGPAAVVAHTVKGKGVSFMEGKFAWHGKAPDDKQLSAALDELKGGVEK